MERCPYSLCHSCPTEVSLSSSSITEMNCFVPIQWYIKVKTLQTSEILLQLASIGMVYNTDFCMLLRFCSF